MELLNLFILLIGGHFIGDYVLQNDAIALGKNRKADPARLGVNWFYWMGSHAVTHGFIVGLITQSVALGIIETILHFIIDDIKCMDGINLHIDQALHFICKILYIAILVYI
jgi:hypothetical protein